MDVIESIDWFLLLLINGLHTPLLDTIFTTLTNKYTWIPFYVIILVVWIKKLGWKSALIALGFLVLGVIITDLVSSKIFKVYFARLRPCHTLMGQTELWCPDGCGGKFGFISSHASNAMGVAVFCIRVFTKRVKGKVASLFAILVLGYVFVNGLSRIYLGVHYPTDVLGGFLFGMISGSFMYYLFSKAVPNKKAS